MRTRGRATRLTFAARLPRSAAICRDLATGHTHSRSRWSKCNLCTMKWNLEIINKVAYVTTSRTLGCFFASVYPQKRPSQPRTSRWSLRVR